MDTENLQQEDMLIKLDSALNLKAAELESVILFDVNLSMTNK